MKKYIISCFALGSILSNAQTAPVLQYIEDQYQYSDNNAMNGSARFNALSGAMGALGGDASAADINPAGLGVFIRSNATISLGVETKTNEVKFGNSNVENSDSNVQLSQASGTFVFEDLQSENWKSVALGFQYANASNFDETLAIPGDVNKLDFAGNSFGGYRMNAEGYANTMNLTVGANYKDTWYFGIAANLSSFRKESVEGYIENNANGETYVYSRVGSPYVKEGEGVSVSLGAIGKINQNLRLGLAYESPTYWSETLLTEQDYYVTNATDNNGEYYYVKSAIYNSAFDAITNQRVTGSAAYVFGKRGLISVDYTLKHYGPTKFKPTKDFAPENDYVSNMMDTSSAIRVGAEAKFQNFTIRGGYRYETSPFEEASLSFSGYDFINDQAVAYTDQYKPYGDLNGFSVGLGYNFNNFYLDASYDYASQDRQFLVNGILYDNAADSYIDADDVADIDEALNLLSVDLEEQGTSMVVKDIKDKLGKFTLTLGFNF